MLWLWSIFSAREETSLHGDTLTSVRLLLANEKFVEFCGSMCELMQQYAGKLCKQAQSLIQRMEQRVSSLCWERAQEFEAIFGLKLNYSLIVKALEDGGARIFLKKRCDLSEPAATPQLLMQTTVPFGSLGDSYGVLPDE